MLRCAITLLAVGACAAATGGNFASAADLSLTPIYKAPAAPAPYDWTGFYVGGHIGGAWDHRDGSVFDEAAGAFLTSGSTRSSGLTGGGQAGFNYPLSRNWIAGLEADISAADLQSSANGAPAFGERDNKIDTFGTVRGRFGYTWNNVLLYGTGGFAWAHEQLARTQQIGADNLATPGTVESPSGIGTGWVAGGGIEWGITPNWVARLEYLHLDLGSQSFTFPLAAQRVDATATIDAVRLGLNYKFNWGWPR
jgi:opacity protein-like surface antigen